jgi:hypothetical protein
MKFFNDSSVKKSTWQSVDNPPNENIFVYGLRSNGDIVHRYFYSQELCSWYYSHGEGMIKKVQPGEITHWIRKPEMPE